MDDKYSDYEEYLLDSSVEIKKPSDSACLRCFKWCCAHDKELSKSYYINKWRKFLSQESENNGHPFSILTHLWAHKNVIKDLENIRLNPNLMSEKNIRNDLEFYIPQLCTFLIFGDYEAVEEFLAFLCKACYASFFFAHRVVWFLKSLINNSTMNEKIEYILQLIQTIFKSEKDRTKLERLHIANSKKYTDLMNKYNLSFLYFKTQDEIDEITLTSRQHEFYLTYKASQNLIQNFCERHYEYSNQLEKFDRKLISEIEEFKFGFYLNPEEVFVNIFRNEVNSIHEDNLNESNNLPRTSNVSSNNILGKPGKQISDLNLLSFLGSVNFVNKLTTICENMKDVPVDEQMAYLRKEIMEINKTLPSNIYIPFLKDSVRNYIIVHIPVTEMRIFKTKNRAPYMMTVEIIRIEEIINTVIKKERKRERLMKANKSNGTNRDSSNEGIPNQEHSVNNISQPIVTPSKGRSYSMVNQDHINDNHLYLVNHQKNDFSLDLEIDKRKINAKSFLDPEVKFDNVRKRSSTLRLLDESNIRLSKPVIISNLEAEIKRTPLMGEKKIILEENEEYEESFIKEDIEEIVKRRLTLNPLSHKSKFLKILEKEDHDNKLNNLNLQQTSNPEEEINLENKKEETVKSRARLHTSCEPSARNNLNLISGKNENEILNSIDETEIDIKNDNVEDLNEIKKETASSYAKKSDKESRHSGVQSINVDFNDIFGELIEDQETRLKNISPFGEFNTWKLFKFIIKSGEDLRQEQFATQLINEFHQIFQLEKVECWVNTYEIIATGNNVGIIECVPNAISIDALKKKIRHNSLRTFFESYYGPVDSKPFKDAMNNFISSLAGYSLVCYFLQIKDRHNANILIDNEGHLIHIDFGFLLSNAPGKGLKFESAPFKLTSEVVEAMGGVNSKYFTKFRKLLWKGFIAIVKHSEKILILVEMMFCGHGKNLPCFQHKEYTIEALKARFYPKPKMKSHDYMRHVDQLIEQSIDNWRTRWYDKFQYYFQGIFY